MAKGTFSAVGVTKAIKVSNRADLSLVFDGTGTVKLQRYMNDGWRDVPNGEWTSSVEDAINSSAAGVDYRLNCTARGADIHWEIR